MRRLDCRVSAIAVAHRQSVARCSGWQKVALVAVQMDACHNTVAPFSPLSKEPMRSTLADHVARPLCVIRICAVTKSQIRLLLQTRCNVDGENLLRPGAFCSFALGLRQGCQKDALLDLELSLKPSQSPAFHCFGSRYARARPRTVFIMMHLLAFFPAQLRICLFNRHGVISLVAQAHPQIWIPTFLSSGCLVGLTWAG